jgi:hypothetical protein
MDQGGKNPGQAKKIPPGAWMSVSCECCVIYQVEVSATGWSLVQRSPTECGVSKKCVTIKPRRNEESQAHIGLSSHRGKIIMCLVEQFVQERINTIIAGVNVKTLIMPHVTVLSDTACRLCQGGGPHQGASPFET